MRDSRKTGPQLRRQNVDLGTGYKSLEVARNMFLEGERTDMDEGCKKWH